jgi:hypothetical protein
VIGDPVIADPAGRVPALPAPVADAPVTADPAARVPETLVPVALVPATVVPAAAVPAALVLAATDPAAPVVLTGEPETAELAAVAGAVLAPVAGLLAAGFGVSVALLPPHAARIALAAMPPVATRNRRRFSAIGRIVSTDVSFNLCTLPSLMHLSSRSVPVSQRNTSL